MGPSACATTVWRFRGTVQVTAIVKATFSFVPGASMALREPDEIHAVDVHYDGDPWSARGLYPGRPDGAAGSAGDPTRSLWAPSDVIPYRQFADVTLVGHAHVSSGRKLAKIAVLNEQTPIDKTIQVESRWSRGSVALVYEHALGGPGSPDNPVGTGLDAGSPKPTLTSLDDPRRPAGFGPIAPTWRARARCLGGLDPAALERPLAELPDLFDWQYFQAAPPDQRTSFLRGDEWILLEGLHAEHAVLRLRLPGLTAAGRVHGLQGGPSPIAFHADSLHLDTDLERCSLTFRGHFAVPDEACLPRLVILAGVGHAARPLPFPGPAPALDPLVAVAGDVSGEEARAEADDDPSFGLETLPFVADRAEPRVLGRQGTVLLKWPEGASEGRPEALPFEAPPPGAPSPAAPPPKAPSPKAPSPEAPSPEATEDDFDTRTVEAAPRLSNAPALPFQVPAQETSDGPFGGTVELRRAADPTPTPMRSPFRLAEPGAPQPRALGDIPGAPWASSSAQAVPRPLHARQQTLPDQPMELLLQRDPLPMLRRPDEDEITVEGRGSEQTEGTSEPAPPPSSAQASEPAKASAPAGDAAAQPDRAWSWATTAEPPRAESAPRVRPPPVPKVEVQRSIYGRFVPGKKP